MSRWLALLWLIPGFNLALALGLLFSGGASAQGTAKHKNKVKNVTQKGVQDPWRD